MNVEHTSSPDSKPAVLVKNLEYRYGRGGEAVLDLDLRVERGRCHALLGRNGAGKSTTLKCLLNLLRPRAGSIEVFGISPQRDEVAVKRRLAYIPEMVAFPQWMTGWDVLKYYSSFRTHWNRDVEDDLLARFGLDASKPVSGYSKGMRSQLALVCALAPEPELLVLDEPTSGLDPIVRRELLQAVIGQYLSAAPGQRTVLVSTHLISEFEGIIDDFTVVEAGRSLLSESCEAAKARFQKLHIRLPGETAEPSSQVAAALGNARRLTQLGREAVYAIQDFNSAREAALREAIGPEGSLRTEALNLEEIFTEAVRAHEPAGATA